MTISNIINPYRSFWMQIFNGIGEPFGLFKDEELLALRLTVIAKLAKQIIWLWESSESKQPFVLYSVKHAEIFAQIIQIKYVRSREKPLRLIWRDYCFEVELRWHYLKTIKVYIFEDLGLTLREVKRAVISHETRSIIRANSTLETNPDGSKESLWEEYLRLKHQSIAHGFAKSREGIINTLPQEKSIQPIPADADAVLVQQTGIVLERQKSEEVKPIQWSPVENSVKSRFLSEG